MMKIVAAVFKQMWITLVLALLLLALYASLGRQFAPWIETRQSQIETWLSTQLGQEVRMAHLSASWSGLSPTLYVRGLSVAGAQGVRIDSLNVELDVVQSLISWLPVFRFVQVEGVQADVRLLPNRQVQLAPSWIITLPESTPDSERPFWAVFLEQQPSMQFQNVRLSLTTSTGSTNRLEAEAVQWRSKLDEHELDAKVAFGHEELAQARLQIFLEGELWPWHKQNGRIYLAAQPRDWARWLPELTQGYAFKTLEVGAEGWLDITQGDLQKAYLKLDIPQLELTTPNKPLHLTQGRIVLAGQHNGQDWHLRGKPEFAQNLPITSFSLSEVVLAQQKGWQLGVPELDVTLAAKYLNEYGLLPQFIAPYIEGTAPKGLARNVRVAVLPPYQDKPWQVDVRADLLGIHSQAYGYIPALTGVDAKLHLMPHRGRVQVHNANFSAHLAPLYAQAWALEQASGAFSWSLWPDHALLKLEGLGAKLVEGDSRVPVHSDLRIELPMHGSAVEASVSLLLGAEQAPIQMQKQLVPNLAGVGLQNWLNQALGQGQANKARFALYTSLSAPSVHKEQALTTELALNFTDGHLSYLPDWPKVEGLQGELYMDLPNLDIDVHRGQTLGATLAQSGAQVRLRPKGKSTQLEVVAKLNGQSAQALGYFTQTPLQQVVNHALDSWKAQGELQADFKLGLDLSAKTVEPQIELQAHFKQNRVQLEDLRLDLHKLSGALSYSSARGLSAQSLKGELLGGAFSARIASSFDAKKHMQIKLNAEGTASLAGVRAWQPLFLFEPLQGTLPYQAELNIGDKVTLDLHSKLKGMRIDLPAPFTKAADEERDLAVRLEAGTPLHLHLRYGEQVAAHLRLDDAGIDRGQVRIGDTQVPELHAEGLFISGHIDAPLVAKDWWQAWQRVMASDDVHAQQSAGVQPSSSPSPNPLQGLNLQLGQVDAWGTQVHNLNVGVAQENNGWAVKLDSALVRGDVHLPEGQPIAMRFDYLRIPNPHPEPEAQNASLDAGTQATEASAAEPVNAEPVATESAPKTLDAAARAGRLQQVLAEDSLADIDPHDLPAMAFKVQELSYFGKNYGSWELSNTPSAQGAEITLHDSDMNSLKVQGQILWSKQDGQARTLLKELKLSTKSVDKVQRGLGVSPVLEGKNTEATLNWSWRGSPAAFNALSLNGTVVAQVRNGKLNAEGAEALKVFGILNFNSLARRLRLDFSDLYQSGVAFDKLHLKAQITDGLLTFTEPLVIDGPGGNFLSSGSTDLVAHSLDMKIAVTFPVASNLPLVVVLAGFAPPIAASIYVTEKLIGDELSRFTSASYNLTGSWEEPKMEMNKLFDNQVKGKETRGVTDRVKGVFMLGD